MSANGFGLSALAALIVLGACSSIPTGPDVLALPGAGKNLEQFNGDDASCRQHALAQFGGTTASPAANEVDTSFYGMQKRYDFAYVQCMYAKGHRVPVLGRPVSQ